MNRDKTSLKKWHILGAGSMGCWWASRLISLGHQVTLLTRNLDTTSCKITVEQNQHTATYPCKALTVRSAVTVNSPTNLMVTLKAYDTLTVLGGMADLLSNYSAIVLMQNGMGVAEKIRQHFPHLRLYIGITNQGAYRQGNLHIVQAGQGDSWIGCLPGELQKSPTEQVSELLDTEPGPVNWDPKIQNRQWAKLAVNCVINGLTVVENCRNGHLTDAMFDQRISALCSEIESVIKQLDNIELTVSLKQEVLRVANATSNNYSSMLQDVQKHRATEVDYLNGYLCRVAATLGIEIPENQRLYDNILALGKSPSRIT